jgi:hypothetical protein
VVEVDCPHCRAAQFADVDGPRICSACGSSFEVYGFRAAARRGAAPEGSVARAGCAEHPDNLSVGSCERCGSFVCSLCATPIEARILCPRCFERLHEAGQLRTTRRESLNWGRLVMVLGLFAWFPFYGCGFGLAAVAIGLYGLRQMRKAPPSKARRVTVITGMTLGIAGALVWIVVLSFMFYSSVQARKGLPAPSPAAAQPAR